MYPSHQAPKINARNTAPEMAVLKSQASDK